MIISRIKDVSKKSFCGTFLPIYTSNHTFFLLPVVFVMINGILVFGAQKRNKNAILVWMILAIFQAIIFAIFSIIGFIDLAETVDRKSRYDIKDAIIDKNIIHLQNSTIPDSMDLSNSTIKNSGNQESTSPEIYVLVIAEIIHVTLIILMVWTIVIASRAYKEIALQKPNIDFLSMPK